MSLSDEPKIAIARKYFHLAGAGDPKLMELFHEAPRSTSPSSALGAGALRSAGW